MILDYRRKTKNLRKGRVSSPGSIYFITFCTDGRRPLLATPRVMECCFSGLSLSVQNGDLEILAATVMPDHVHLLIRLSGRLPLGRVMAKLKTTMSKGIWQANFFEHRLHADEEAELYAWYIFMNPYTAGLVGDDRVWPGWWPVSEKAWRFLAQANPGPCPQRAWMAEFKERSRLLATGE